MRDAKKKPEPPQAAPPVPPLPQPAQLPLHVQLSRDCQVMARFLISSGATLPSSLIERLAVFEETGKPCRELVEIHNRLARMVAPATPRSLVYLARAEAARSGFDFLGEVPLVRRMMAVALSSTLLLFCVSLSPLVSGGAHGFDLLSNSGYSLFLHLLFLVAAASIGACFANLYRVKGYVKDGTFDPVYESSYWIRYVLGLLAGTLVALLIPIETWLAGADKGGSASIVQTMGKPTLALLGGFSSSAVYRILDRMVTALESVVSGDPRDAAALQGRLWESRMNEREAQTRLEAVEQAALQAQPAAGEEPRENAGDEPRESAGDEPPPRPEEAQKGWDEMPVRPAPETAAPLPNTPN